MRYLIPPMTKAEEDREKAVTFMFLAAIICAGIGVGMLTERGWGWVTVALCLFLWVGLAHWFRRA